MVDWNEALRVAAIGFGGVFAILILLMLFVMAIGAIMRRVAKAPEKAASDVKKE